MKFTVYYAHDIGSWITRPPVEPIDLSNFKKVCVVDADDLEDVFRMMNVVDGDELPVKLRVRSMCVGDLVQQHEDDVWWFCAAAGWEAVKVSGDLR